VTTLEMPQRTRAYTGLAQVTAPRDDPTARHNCRPYNAIRPARSTRCCAWFDEFNQSQVECADASAFATAHQTFAVKRHDRLAQAAVHRRYELQPLNLGTNPE